MEHAIGLAMDIFGLPAGIGLLVSGILAWLAMAALSRHRFNALVSPMAVALGFAAGYAALPREWARLIPEADRPWQWLPYCGAAAAIFSILAAGSKRPNSGGCIATVAAMLIAATLLTPSWPVLGLGRFGLSCALFVYLVVIGIPLQLLPEQAPIHVPSRWLAILLVVAATLLAVVTGALLSARLAQLAAIGAAALAGVCLAGAMSRAPTANRKKTLVPVFTAIVGGTAWVACVEPDPPKLVLLALPAIPLLLWIVAAVSRRGSSLTR